MWQDLDGLGGAGVNSGAHQVDQFCATELTPEEQKILIDIRRKKTELLLAIQVSQLPYFTKPFYLRPRFPARIRACREKTFPAVLSSAGCRYSVFRMHCSLTNFIIDFDRNFHSAR